MAELVRQALPLFGGYINSESDETWQDVERKHFLTTLSGL